MQPGRTCRLLTAGVFCCLLHVAFCAAEDRLDSGIDRSTFDSTVKPGNDFFEYVNGTWIKQNPIPPEYSRWGAFPKLRDDNLTHLRDILEHLTKAEDSVDANHRKLRDFYATAMDEARLEKAGADPLADVLARIAKVNSPKELVAEAAHLHLAGAGPLLRVSVDQDEKQSNRYALYLNQGGLGLPERDYYVGTGADSKRILDLYRVHVGKMLELLGDSPKAASAGAEAVLRIETKLAEASRTPVELRDREAQYNKMALAKLAALTPQFDWSLYFKTVEVEGLADVIVGQPEFLTRLNELLGSIPMEDWRIYLRWHTVHAMASFLSSKFETENFNFYSGELRGIKQMQPRWKRAVGTIDGLMGEALGRLYVDKHFKPAAKQRMDELVKNLVLTYRDRLESRDWMGAETKKHALDKLTAITPKIGYPDKWRDYSALEIRDDSYAENVLRAEAFDVRYELSKLGKPVDRTEWGMTPPTVNAYYNPSMNEIVFPAGILQPPFFSADADDAVNYGGIGAVIGHEITHGFDDQGSRYDADGNMRNWWTSDDRAQFNAKADKLVKQYDACTLLDSLHVNGRLTLGENLADLGGVAIAYAAYQKSLQGREAPKIDGFTGAQRFFIGYAQVWRGTSRDAELRLRLRTDPHSPANFRVVVPLSNVQAFYDAFGIKPGDAMYREPKDRVEVW